MTTNNAIWWHRDVVVITLDDAHGKFVITEHVAAIVKRRVRQHQEASGKQRSGQG